MAIKQIFKVNRKTFFDPRSWVNYDGLKQENGVIWSALQPLFTAPTPGREESFDQAMTRLGLSEEDVKSFEKTYYAYAMFFVVLGILTILLSFYLMIMHTFIGLFLGIPVAGLFLAQAFRFHFWYFQIKNRKLGCTFDEWRQGKVKKKEGTTS